MPHAQTHTHSTNFSLQWVVSVVWMCLRWFLNNNFQKNNFLFQLRQNIFSALFLHSNSNNSVKRLLFSSAPVKSDNFGKKLKKLFIKNVLDKKKVVRIFLHEKQFRFGVKMDAKMNIWDKQQQNWIKEILSKSGTELKEIGDKNGKIFLRLIGHKLPSSTSDLIFVLVWFMCERGK